MGCLVFPGCLSSHARLLVAGAVAALAVLGGCPAVSHAASPHDGGQKRAAAEQAARAGSFRGGLIAPVTADTLWFRYNESGMHAFNCGRLDEAAGLFRDSFRAAAHFDRSDVRLATILTNLAVVYRETGKHAAAEHLLAKALQIKKESLPPSHPSVVSTSRHLVALYRRMGRESDALSLERAIRQASEVPLPEQADPAPGLLAPARLAPARLASAPGISLPVRASSRRLAPDLPSADEWLREPGPVYAFAAEQALEPLTQPPRPPAPVNPRDFIYRRAPYAFQEGGMWQDRLAGTQLERPGMAYPADMIARVTSMPTFSSPAHGSPCLKPARPPDLRFASPLETRARFHAAVQGRWGAAFSH